FIAPATPVIYTLSLHDALPISLGFVDHVFTERHFHVQDVGGVEQPVGVFFQPENCRAIRGVVRTHAFKAAKAVMQGMSEYVGFGDRKSTRLNSSHVKISYAVFC